MSVIENAELDSVATTFSGGGEIRYIAAAAQLAPGDFSVNAADIFATYAHARDTGHPRMEGIRRATEAYVVDEPNPLKRLQADVIINAQYMAQVSGDQNRMQEALKSDPRNEQLQDESLRMKRQLVRYNHAVRDLIANSDGKLRAHELKNWLEKGSNGNTAWAERTVSGVAAEVAAAAAIDEIPTVSVQFASVEEDLRGVDLKVIPGDGRPAINVDVKVGGNRPLDNLGVRERNGQRVYEVGLESRWMDGFYLDASGRRSLQGQIETILG